MRGEMCGPGGGRGRGAAAARKQISQGGPNCGVCWHRPHTERTTNMRPMSVTLDVSKLSGWLNPVACCRAERRAPDVGRGRAGREAVLGRRAAAAHVKHGPHVCDFGRAETQRLVERVRILPSRKGATQCEARCEPGGRMEGIERTRNISVIRVTLDVSKLSVWLNAVANCRVEREAYGKRGDMRGRATRGRGVAAVQAVCMENRTQLRRLWHARSTPQTCSPCL